MLTKLRQKIEGKRCSKSLFWRALVFGKDFAWKILTLGKDFIWKGKVCAYNLAKSKKYQKFIILGRSRTGSTFLTDLLESHSQTKIYHGLFNLKGLSKNKHILKNPIEFLEKEIFRRYPDNVKAVGFKLFYHHIPNNIKDYAVALKDVKAADAKRLEGVWYYLKHTPGLKIIHLKRRDLLKVGLSRKIAYQSGKWDSMPLVKEITPIKLNYGECLELFEQTRRWEEKYDNFFKSKRKIEVIYENLEKDLVSETERIQRFLGLRLEKLHSFFEKQNKKRPSEAISNYWELKKRFSETRWAGFFED